MRVNYSYYLYSEEKKVWMPIIALNLSGLWMVDKRHVLDFIHKAGDDIRLILEGSLEWEKAHDEEYEYINSWWPYKEEEGE